MQTTERLTISTRAMDAEDRGAWERELRFDAKRAAESTVQSLAGRIAGLILVALVVGFFVARKWGYMSGALAALAGIGLAAAQPWADRRNAMKADDAKARLRASQQKFEAGQVEVVTIRPLAAVEAEEWEDLGANYFLDVGEGTILYLGGQWCYGEELFLRERVELVRIPGEWWPLRTFADGAILKPLRVIPSEKTRELAFPGEEICTFEGTLTTLEDDLAQLNRQR